MASPPPWHPIMKAQEYKPGQWLMNDSTELPYALVDLVKRGGELGYRAVTWAQNPSERVLIGYFRTLRGACRGVHDRELRDITPHNRDPLAGHRMPGKANTPARVERD